jgi:hypothetical protein
MPTPTGISGSRAAAILGLSKYSTPFTVWQDIQEQRHGDGWNKSQGYVYEPFQGNSITEFGHAFEDSIVALTEKVTGHQITDREMECHLIMKKTAISSTFLPSQRPEITCHIDGKIFDYTKLFEGKHTNFRVFGMDWGEPGTDRVPTAIQCQVQHNMAVTGLTEAIVSVLVIPATVQDFEDQGWQAHYDSVNGVHFLKNHNTEQIIDPMKWASVFAEIGNFHQYHIEAKPDTQKLLLEMYEDFWQKYVIGETPPDVVDYEDVRRVFSEPKGTLIISETDTIAGELIADAMREYKDINGQIGNSGRLAKRKIFLKTKILDFAKDKTTVLDDESQEKIVFRDETGKKLGQFDGKTFRS